MAEDSRPIPIPIPPDCPDHRLDRDEFYLGLMIALWFAGLGIIIAPIDTGTVATLEASTQTLLAIAMMVGATFSLTGASLGPGGGLLHRFLPKFPVRHAYIMGLGGLAATAVALGFFGWTILTNGTVLGTATGLLCPVLFFSALIKIKKMWLEYRRRDRDYELVKRVVLEVDKVFDDPQEDSGP